MRQSVRDLERERAPLKAGVCRGKASLCAASVAFSPALACTACRATLCSGPSAERGTWSRAERAGERALTPAPVGGAGATASTSPLGPCSSPSARARTCAPSLAHPESPSPRPPCTARWPARRAPCAPPPRRRRRRPPHRPPLSPSTSPSAARSPLRRARMRPKSSRASSPALSSCPRPPPPLLLPGLFRRRPARSSRAEGDALPARWTLKGPSHLSVPVSSRSEQARPRATAGVGDVGRT